MAVLTKSLQVERKLRRGIMSGKWNVGDRLPADQELCTQFGVSSRTIREALLHLERDGIIERRQGSGTYVARTTELGYVGILAHIENLSSPWGFWYQQLVKGSRGIIDPARYTCYFSVGYGETTEELAASVHLFDQVQIQKTRGIISTLNLGPLYDKLVTAGIPCVSVIAKAPVGPYCVALDYESLFQQAAETLVAQGYPEFAIIDSYSGEDHFNQPVVDRYDAVLRDLAKPAGRRLIRIARQSPFSNMDVYEAFKQIMQSADRPRAIFITDDFFCDAVLRAVRELNIRVPEDLAILTHANALRPFESKVPLSTVEFDPAEAVAQAWKMLEPLMDGRELPSNVTYLKPRVVLRASL